MNTAANTTMLPSSSHGDSRRSERVLLSIPVEIHGEDLSSLPFSEKALTLVVNAHGALVRMRSFVVLNQILTIQNGQTHEELYCRVARFQRDAHGNVEVGLEFLHPSPRFWRIAFPPSDWAQAVTAVPGTGAQAYSTYA